ncbi:uncharacterized protein C8A04DRAFT_28106 [Dichotomopilus funicola]|uniref:Developmental regulatory protein wetA n=1 Tax=Dichotomopilus funicola TaxID=1934379 RepID=A0AAN6ZNJ0_9PEZI|nr:hypothetical protein C8A04DRAFT_28106 [Dichotomopilus funicola]
MSATATAIHPSMSAGPINQGGSGMTADSFGQYIKLEPGAEGEAGSGQGNEQDRRGSDGSGSGQGGGLAQFSGTHGLLASPLFASPTSGERGQVSTVSSSRIQIKEEVSSSKKQQPLQPPLGSGYISTGLFKPNSTSTLTTASNTTISPLRTRLGALCTKLRDKAATLKESRPWSPISPSIFLLSAATPTEAKTGKTQLPSAMSLGGQIQDQSQDQGQGLGQGQSQYQRQEPEQKGLDGQAGLNSGVLEDPFSTGTMDITGSAGSNDLIRPLPYTPDGLPVSIAESWQLPMPTTNDSPWASAEYLGAQETSHWWDPALNIMDTETETDFSVPITTSTSLPYHTLNAHAINAHSVALNNAANSLAKTFVPPTTSFDYPLSLSLSLSQPDINTHTNTSTTTNTDLLLHMPQPRSSISPAQTLLRGDTPRPPTTTTTDSRRRSSRSRRPSSGGIKHHRHPYHHYNNSVLAAQRAQRSSSSSSSSASPSPKMSVLAGPPHAHLRGHQQQHRRSASESASAQTLPGMGMGIGMGIGMGMTSASSSSTSLPLGYPLPPTQSPSQQPGLGRSSSGSPSPPRKPKQPNSRDTNNPNPNNPNPHSHDKEKYSDNTKDGFVNYTPHDSALLMTGVAPSGSSKTKARREREAAERQRAFRERLARAVRAAGGDVRRLGGFERSKAGDGMGEGMNLDLDGQMEMEMGYEVGGGVDGDVDMDGNGNGRVNRGPGRATGSGLGKGIGV